MKVFFKKIFIINSSCYHEFFTRFKLKWWRLVSYLPEARYFSLVVRFLLFPRPRPFQMEFPVGEDKSPFERLHREHTLDSERVLFQKWITRRFESFTKKYKIDFFRLFLVLNSFLWNNLMFFALFLLKWIFMN